MANSNSSPFEVRVRFRRSVRLVPFLTVCFIAETRGQAPEASSYPVDPVAAAGMTSGLPNGVTYRQAEMMQVRTAAQGAQGEASAAAMARAADQSIEERNRAAALQTARTNKAIKDEMRNRLKFEQAAAVQQKVTAHDMSTWEQNGGVRVERNVPDAFLLSLIEEEEQAAARAGTGRKRGFPFFGGGDDSSDGEGLSFLSSIRPPRLPFIGGGGADDESSPTASAPPASDNSEPVFATGSRPPASSPAPARTPTPTTKPGVVPMISGAALVDGRSPVNPGSNPASADAPPSGAPTSFASDHMPEPEKRKTSLFSMFGSSEPDEEDLVPSSRGSGGGGGFFGFGRKKVSQPGPYIDASLFPEGAADEAPRGGRLSGGSAVASNTAGTPSFASSSSSGEPASAMSSGSVELPGRTVEKARGSGFSLPKPNLSLPSLPTLSKSEGGGASGATGYHVVTSTAQFMVYGAEQMQSEIRALPAGTSVLVTKPGDQWAGIRLPDGTEGVVQNKHLKAAGGQ